MCCGGSNLDLDESNLESELEGNRSFLNQSRMHNRGNCNFNFMINSGNKVMSHLEVGRDGSTYLNNS